MGPPNHELEARLRRSSASWKSSWKPDADLVKSERLPGRAGPTKPIRSPIRTCARCRVPLLARNIERHRTCVNRRAAPLASSSRTQVPSRAVRAFAHLTSGVVSTVVHQCPWLVVAEVTHLVTRHQPDQPVAGPCHGADAPRAEGIAPLPRRATHGFVSHDHTVPAVAVDLADPLDDPAPAATCH